jgi:hypothetical protein
MEILKKEFAVTMRPAFFSAVLLGSSLYASDYTFLNEDLFVREKCVFHFEADFGQVGSAKVTSGLHGHGTSLNYGEGNSSLYFSHFLNQENSLTWQAGANFVNLGWKNNPNHFKNEYTYGISSLTWISHSLERWRWVLNGGVAVDATTFNFGRSGVYYTMLWGRYAQTEHLGVHLGFFGYYGTHNGYMLPILGVDWQIAKRWEFKGVFPIDLSLTFDITRQLKASILATSLGGPYRFPRRIHGGNDTEFGDGIFKIYSTVLEADLKFIQKNFFQIGAGGGWNFGGWLQLTGSHNHHKTYYQFDGAAYARVFGTLTF